jgi:hypothetical protein
MAPGFSGFGARFANARFIRGIGPSDQRPDRHRDEARSMHLRNQGKGKDTLSRLLAPREDPETIDPETDDPETDDPETDPETGDPSAGGLSAAVGDVEPIDDAEAILAENLADGEAGADEAQAAEYAAPAPAAAGPSGLLARVAGAALLLAGVVVAVLAGRGTIPPALMEYGLQPATLFTVGAVVLGVGMVRRQIRLLGSSQRDEVLESLQFLVDHQRASAERPPAKGEELDRVLAQLERQDEKVNNLTKALKAYGKPLLEIASSSADVTAQIDALRSGQQKVETAMRGAGSGEAVAALRDQSAKLEKHLHDQFAAFGEKVGHGGLQQQLTRMEASVQAIGQRLDDSEVRKSLLRLEEADKARGKKLDEVARAETLQHDVARLEQRIDQNVGKLGAALDQVRNGNLGPLEHTVRDMQRELAGLCTAVAQIQQAVRSGGGRAAAPAPMAAAPSVASAPVHAAEPPRAAAHAPAAPTHAAPAHAAPAAASAPSPAVDTKGLSDAQAGVAQNQTGARASTGKNVLGAIAKLKKMKT